jgi:hypothetical protein
VARAEEARLERLFSRLRTELERRASTPPCAFDLLVIVDLTQATLEKFSTSRPSAWSAFDPGSGAASRS